MRDFWTHAFLGGLLLGQLVLASNQHILGFGAQSAYVITTDDDGIQRLTRHPWPSARRPARKRSHLNRGNTVEENVLAGNGSNSC